MVTVGYAKSYAKSYCGKMWDNPLIKAAIARIDAKMQAKSERTVESIDAMQQEAYDLAMRIKRPSAAVSAGTAIARLYGMDKDAGSSSKDVPAPITASDLALLRSMARAITDSELAQPVLDVVSVSVEAISKDVAVDRGKDE